MHIKKYAILLLFIPSTNILAHEQPLPMPKIENYAFSLFAPYTHIVAKKAPPSIGIYGPEYPMRPTLARIQLSPEMIKNAPAIIKGIFPPEIPDIILNVVISSAEHTTYNMVFHAWARNWYRERLFDINIPMGIFLANGVQPSPNASITFNALREENVHVHEAGDDALAYSPHNAQFTVSTQRQISSFWSVAVSPDRQHAIVTFHILANNTSAQEMIENNLITSNTLQQFLQQLAQNSTIFTNPIDQQTLLQAIQTIGTIVRVPKTPVEGSARQTQAPRALAERLTSLTQELRNLTQALGQTTSLIYHEEPLVHKFQ